LVPKLFETLRLKFGDDVHLLHDAHHRLTPIEAARLGKSLEPYHLFWLEDAVTAELQEGFRIVRQHTTTPLALGEVFNTIWDATTIITEQLIDYIRMATVHGGGITHLKKVASLAENRGHSDVVDQLFGNDRGGVPNRVENFSQRQRCGGVLADNAKSFLQFRRDGIFEPKEMIRLETFAKAGRFDGCEAVMRVVEQMNVVAELQAKSLKQLWDK